MRSFSAVFYLFVTDSGEFHAIVRPCLLFLNLTLPGATQKNHAKNHAKNSGKMLNAPHRNSLHSQCIGVCVCVCVVNAAIRLRAWNVLLFLWLVPKNARVFFVCLKTAKWKICKRVYAKLSRIVAFMMVVFVVIFVVVVVLMEVVIVCVWLCAIYMIMNKQLSLSVYGNLTSFFHVRKSILRFWPSLGITTKQRSTLTHTAHNSLRHSLTSAIFLSLFSGLIRLLWSFTSLDLFWFADRVLPQHHTIHRSKKRYTRTHKQTRAPQRSLNITENEQANECAHVRVRIKKKITIK